MREFVVRPSRLEDLEDITRIYRHYVMHTTATFELEPPDAEEMGRRRAGVLKAGMPYVTAEEDGVVVGYAYTHAYRPRAAYRFTVEDSIYVDPEAVGMGCGQALLGALIAKCELGPWRQMVAVIGGSDNEASIALHKRCGFHEIGILGAVGYKFEHWVDSVLMQRELGAGAMTVPK
jgi:phosphinothricin acetyltransferase